MSKYFVIEHMVLISFIYVLIFLSEHEQLLFSFTELKRVFHQKFEK